ncbi:hypothetical protein L9F63_002479, partial [Diploptera punctata]
NRTRVAGVEGSMGGGVNVLCGSVTFVNVMSRYLVFAQLLSYRLLGIQKWRTFTCISLITF